MKYIFICPRPSTPSGGVDFIHRIVRLLNELGINAVVYHEEPFQIWWSSFQLSEEYIFNEKPISEIDDVMVIPEVRWHDYSNSKLRKICFLQNWLWCPKLDAGTEVLVCSRYLANYATRTWNANVIGKVTPFLDDIWKSAEKIENSVLLFARRNDYWQSMKDMLLESGFTVDLITEPLSQLEIAKRMSTADYYVHLSHPEGFVAAALEAMRSGAIVVGTTGGGGGEIMHQKETAWTVQDPTTGHYDNSNGEYQSRIMEGLLHLRGNKEDRERIREQACQWSLRYTQEATKQELKRIFL